MKGWAINSLTPIRMACIRIVGLTDSAVKKTSDTSPDFKSDATTSRLFSASPESSITSKSGCGVSAVSLTSNPPDALMICVSFFVRLRLVNANPTVKRLSIAMKEIYLDVL